MFSKVSRQSNFELLRLFAMFLIIWYHLLCEGFLPFHSEYTILKSSYIVLHIAVVCFVLISGYFGIKPSIIGFLRLLGMIFIYSIPNIVFGCYHAGTYLDICKSLMFISNTSYWFVGTYLLLYLLSPLLNKFNLAANFKEKIYILVILGFITIYIGNVAMNPLYVTSKHVINFMFYYQIGAMLNYTKDNWTKISGWRILMVYVMWNAILISVYVCMNGTILSSVVWHLSYPYNSPFLICNAILVFMLFGKLKISSPLINKLAAGVLAAYMIHESISYGINLYTQGVEFLYQHIGSMPLFMVATEVFAIIILFVCLGIHYILTPIWKLLDIVSQKIAYRVNLKLKM